jgi:hypothetical protein
MHIFTTHPPDSLSHKRKRESLLSNICFIFSHFFIRNGVGSEQSVNCCLNYISLYSFIKNSLDLIWNIINVHKFSRAC